MIWVWRPKSQRPMWPPAVVVGTVPGKDGPQVPLTEDQDPVGEFSAGAGPAEVRPGDRRTRAVAGSRPGRSWCLLLPRVVRKAAGRRVLLW